MTSQASRPRDEMPKAQAGAHNQTVAVRFQWLLRRASFRTRRSTSNKTSMGRLVGLELHNFKSYKGTAKIGLGNAPFTSIIGPNGAGKSNMMDAISFVLGVQSAQLRSHTLNDLIYRGPLELASEAPTSAHVCALYEKDSGELVQFMRTIKQAGGSDYKINGTNVTALQYSLALKNENILVKARNFLVFQGDIENVAAQSPKEMSRLVEAISGSLEYLDEYELLREELERARDVAAEVFSRKRTLTSDSNQYKEQMRERDLFEVKLNEKNRYVKIYYLYKLFHNQKRHFLALQNTTTISEKLAAARERLASEDAALQGILADSLRLSLDRKRLDAEVFDLKSAADSKRRALVPVASNKKLLESRIRQTTSKLENLTVDLANQENLASQLTDSLADANQALELFDAEMEALTSRINVPPEGMKQYEDLRNRFLASSGSSLEEAMSIVENDKNTLVSSVRSIETRKQDARDRILDLESTVRWTYDSKISDLEVILNDLLSQRAMKKSAKDELIKRTEENHYAELEATTKLRTIHERLDEVSSLQKETQSQKHMRDNVLMLRNSIKDGAIKGLLGELVRSSQRKYDSALQTSLGRYQNAIVVESLAVAHKCIEILKERRSGTAIFIPLDSVVIEQHNLNYLRSLSDNAWPALDLAKFEDQSIERAVRFALGGTIIVDNIDIARELKWGLANVLGCKFVALNGSIIHKSGLMTSGQTDSKALTWSKQELSELRKEKEELTQRLVKLQNEKPKDIDLSNLIEEMALIDDEIPQVRSKIENLQRLAREKKMEISHQLDVVTSLDADLILKKEALVAVDEKIAGLQLQIKSLQNQVYTDFCEQYGLRTIDEFECLHGPAMRSRSRQRAQLQRDIQSNVNKLAFQEETIKETRYRIDKLELTKEELGRQLSSVDETFESISNALQIEQNKVELVAETLSRCEKDLDEALQEAKVKEESKKEMEAEVKVLAEEHSSSEEHMQKIDSERLNIFKNCKLESIELPLEDGFLESVSLEVETHDVSLIAYQLQVDYTLLDGKLQERYSLKTEAELSVAIENVQKELEMLAPNSKALERLREVDQRIKDFDREFNKARQDEKRALNRFNELKQLRSEAFMKAFAHISDKIDGIYKELTKSEAAPLGGSAYLTLEDEDEPYGAGIRYHAMPPMKRFRDMELLSGGEKTMAALALLFAIHTYMPSPFFVLDEIDAALDNSNVARISNYIKNHAGPGFQFIVISLKSSLFENSDALIGIYREQREKCTKTVSLDLRQYSGQPKEVPISGDPGLASGDDEFVSGEHHHQVESGHQELDTGHQNPISDVHEEPVSR